MKSILCGLCLLVAYGMSAQPAKRKTPTPKRQPTIIDSLQGRWVSTQDWRNTVIVKGRFYTEKYLYKGEVPETFRIYFSDTLFDCINTPVENIKIDTNALSGKYLILKSVTDKDEYWTYIWDGFSQERNMIFFSIWDTWAKRRPQVFKRKL